MTGNSQSKYMQRLTARKKTKYIPTAQPGGEDTRECLKCRKDFVSSGPGNRIFTRCGILNASSHGLRTPLPVGRHRDGEDVGVV